MGFMVQMASTNTIIQTAVDPDKLGRVLSICGVALFGGMPIGALIGLFRADIIGPRPTLSCCGLAVLASAVLFGVSRRRDGTRELRVP
jgi:predicted MFS family arabinose efflux permease